MSRPPDHLRTEPHHMPPDPCVLCGRGKRPGTRCCARQLKYIRYERDSDWIQTQRQQWREALRAILDPAPPALRPPAGR